MSFAVEFDESLKINYCIPFSFWSLFYSKLAQKRYADDMNCKILQFIYILYISELHRNKINRFYYSTTDPTIYLFRVFCGPLHLFHHWESDRFG